MAIDDCKLLFASPLLRFQHPGSELFNAELWRDGLAWRQQSDGVQRSNQQGWHSSTDLFLRPERSFAALRDWILGCCAEASLAIHPGFDLARHRFMAEAWANINGPGGFNTPHDHAGFCWSGVYYVKLPATSAPDSRSGHLELLDPRCCVSGHSLPGAPPFAPKFRIAPCAGQLVLFPSYLRHWVYPNASEEERMSIAFNLRYVPKASAPAAQQAGGGIAVRGGEIAAEG